jgi:hypothetical protein
MPRNVEVKARVDSLESLRTRIDSTALLRTAYIDLLAERSTR